MPTLVLVLVGGGAWFWNKQRVGKGPEKIGRTVIASTGVLALSVSETGTLEPVTKVDVKSRVAGRIQKIFVKPGITIRVGAPIAVIDPTEAAREVAGIQAQVSASRAGLSQAIENQGLTARQNNLAIRRAEVALKNAILARQESEGNLTNSRIALREAEASQTQARRQLAQTSAPTRTQEIAQAEQQLRRAQASLTDAERLATRRQNLTDKGFLSQQEADSAKTQAALAQADVESAKQRLNLLKEGPRAEDIATVRAGVELANIRLEQAKNTVRNAQLRLDQSTTSVENARVELATQRTNATQAQLRQRDVERARADLSQLENRLAQQSVQLTETRIVAPIAGEVTGKYLEEGELVASATGGFAQGAAIVTIADLTRMQVKVNINEVDVTRLRVGLPVDIAVDGVEGKTFAGHVDTIAPASASQAPGQSAQSGSAAGVVRFEVKIAVDTPDKRLRPGMTAAAKIIVTKKEKVLTLPAEALRPGDKVKVVVGEGDKAKTEERKVTLGLKNDSMVEITSGLKDGDKVEVPKVEASDRRKVEMGPDN
ncbi:MAG: efflux RND transporter periplasmic adaptor subunit [Armatimonas sp.]